MKVETLVHQLSAALAAPSNRWVKLDDIAGYNHYTGTGHSEWIFQLLLGPFGFSNGTALKLKEGLVVRLTPDLIKQAAKLALEST